MVALLLIAKQTNNRKPPKYPLTGRITKKLLYISTTIYYSAVNERMNNSFTHQQG